MPEALPKIHRQTQIMTSLVPIHPHTSTILQVMPEMLPKFQNFLASLFVANFLTNKNLVAKIWWPKFPQLRKFWLENNISISKNMPLWIFGLSVPLCESVCTLHFGCSMQVSLQRSHNTFWLLCVSQLALIAQSCVPCNPSSPRRVQNKPPDNKFTHQQHHNETIQHWTNPKLTQ